MYSVTHVVKIGTTYMVLSAFTVNEHFKIIYQYYPIRDHNFMPFDITFGIMKLADQYQQFYDDLLM